KALSADRPTVLDVHTDPNMPPIPPHATWEQFKSVATAVLSGDEDSWGFTMAGIKTKAQEFLPHRNG
ncbi:MAG TPA: thiamine pyrophosphate-requiring protein, partial [Rhodococcus sp. (in: high G+C Gram-positive bacteria)]|nr:thiamine pyrophosphate-requiring protein [Rhodococcus sp. (in: high G+C Gram-positive bacteria)]